MLILIIEFVTTHQSLYYHLHCTDEKMGSERLETLYTKFYKNISIFETNMCIRQGWVSSERSWREKKKRKLLIVNSMIKKQNQTKSLYLTVSSLSKGLRTTLERS